MIRMLGPATFRESSLAITVVLEAGNLPEGLLTRSHFGRLGEEQ